MSRLELDIDAALAMAKRDDELLAVWIHGRKAAGDSGPLLYENGLVWTAASNTSFTVDFLTGRRFEQLQSTIERAGLTNSAESSRLGFLLDQALEVFRFEHGEFLRKTCGIEELTEGVLVWTFIGHALSKAIVLHGFDSTHDNLEHLMDKLSDAISAAEADSSDVDNIEPI